MRPNASSFTVSTFVLCAVLLLPEVAAAQSATALVAEGVALRERGRDADALERFRRALEISPDSGEVLAQVALAEHAIGRTVEAETHLTLALTHDGDRFVRRNRRLLEQALEEIRGQIGDIAPRSEVPGVELRVDGEPAGTLPLVSPLRHVAGTAHVEASAPGYRPFSAEVVVRAGERSDLAIVLEPLTSESTPESGRERPRGPRPIMQTSSGGGGMASWAVPVGGTIAGLGVVGLGVGVGLAVVREDHAQARQRCTDSEPGCRDHYQAAVDAETGAIASFVVGGALAVGGTVLLVMGVLDSGSTPSDEASVLCAPGLLGIQCIGRF